MLEGILYPKVKCWHIALRNGAVFVHHQAGAAGALCFAVDEKRQLRDLKGWNNGLTGCRGVLSTGGKGSQCHKLRVPGATRYLLGANVAEEIAVGDLLLNHRQAKLAAQAELGGSLARSWGWRGWCCRCGGLCHLSVR